MKPSHVLLPTSAALVALVASQQAQAAGFAIREQSATAQTNAFAGATAGAKDASYMFFNPAALALQQGHQAHVSLSYILPQAEFRDGEASTSAGIGGGVEIAGTDNEDDIAKDALVPAVYLSTELIDRLTVGLGVNAPFGLTTENEEGWIGRYHALDSELTSVNINPAVAIKASDAFSFGLGLQVQYIDTELTNAIDIGSLGAALEVPGSDPTNQDGEVELEADDWGFGYTIGALFTPSQSTRFGLAFRSEIDHRADGSADFDNGDSGAVGAALNANGLLLDTGASAEVTTPATISAGAYHEYGNGLALMAEIAWTNWSVFDELRVEFDDGQDDSVTTEDWEDSFFVALGARYQLTPKFALNGGVAYDETPIPDDTRTPRIPGSDRYWVAFGGEYDLTAGISLNASYTHIFMEDGDVDLEAGVDPAGENFFRGDLSGRYENQIDIITIGGTIRF